jgi:hypothetical protein
MGLAPVKAHRAARQIILVVDDDELLAKMIAELLAR